MITKGTQYIQTLKVEAKDTAVNMGSGHLKVLATPALVASMENTAVKCIENFLENGTDTVGIEIHVKHLKASVVGQTIRYTATVSEVDDRRIRFDIKAEDPTTVIATATHDRFIINPEKFMSKL